MFLILLFDISNTHQDCSDIVRYNCWLFFMFAVSNDILIMMEIYLLVNEKASGKYFPCAKPLDT